MLSARVAPADVAGGQTVLSQQRSVDPCCWSWRSLTLSFPISTYRATEHFGSHSEPLRSSMWTQVEDPTSLQAPPTSATQPPQYQQWERELDPDREHPLTRLELALAEVQQCSSSERDVAVRIHDNGGSTETSHGPTRSLSVLEKVSRFERRERAGKQRSHSTCNSQNSVTHLRVKAELPHDSIRLHQHTEVSEGTKRWSSG